MNTSLGLSGKIALVTGARAASDPVSSIALPRKARMSLSPTQPPQWRLKL